MKKSVIFLMITCVILLAVLGIFEKKEHYFQNRDKETKRAEETVENESIMLEENSDMPDADIQMLTPLDASTTKEEMQSREAIGLSEDKFQDYMNAQKENYAFALLTEEQLRQVYIEIYTVLVHQAENIILSTNSVEQIDYAFQCVMNDHPEIFYVTGYTYTKYSVNDEVKRVSISGTYTMDADTISQMQKAIDRYTQKCFAGMDASADDYHKVKYIYEYLIRNTEYDLSAKENQNICSVCIYGKSVCQGYAKTMQYLLNQLQIPTTLVIGYVNTGEGHAWNLVKMDDAYYYVDTTWGDAFYQLEGKKESDIMSSAAPKINYDYLGVTTEQLLVTHTIDNIVPMPQCFSMDDNYYVREGAYFTTYELERVGQLFDKAYEEKRGFVTLKCANETVFREMKADLLDHQTVFHFMGNETEKIAYTSNDDQKTFTFWL